MASACHRDPALGLPTLLRPNISGPHRAGNCRLPSDPRQDEPLGFASFSLGVTRRVIRDGDCRPRRLRGRPSPRPGRTRDLGRKPDSKDAQLSNPELVAPCRQSSMGGLME